MEARKTFGLNSRVIYLIYLPCSIVSLNFLDPINWPKQIALFTVLPLSVLYLARINVLKNILQNRSFQLLAITSLGFLISALYNFQSIPRLLWGAWGRNNGLITLLSLVTIAFIFSLVSNFVDSETAILNALSISFIPASVYGLLQAFGRDPINWSAKGQVFSFFGNPNFASSILAVSTIAAAYSYWISRSRNFRLIHLAQAVASFVVVWNTKSIQGLVLIFLAASLTALVVITKKLHLNFKFSLGVFFLFSALVFMGFLGKGVLGDFLFQYTMKLRLFYWETGLKMGFANPIFGVGIDSFGDNYRSFRTLEIARTTSVDLTVDNAHNSIIQIFATLGVFGLVSYLLPLFHATKQVSRNMLNNVLSTRELGMSILFIGTFLISLISIDNIAVAVIHWSLLGYFLGKSKNYEKSSKTVSYKKTSSKINSSTLDARNAILTWISCLVFFGFSWSSSSGDRSIISIFNTPAVSNDRQSVDSRWKSLYSLSTQKYLLQEAHYRYIVDGIQATDTWNIALVSAQKGLAEYPKDFLLLDRAAVVSEKLGKFDLAEEYRAKQLALDPRHSLVWLYYARAQYEQGKIESAQASIKQAEKYRELLDSNGLAYMQNLISKIS